MEEKGPECSRQRESAVRSPSRSKALKSRGHRGRSATTRRMSRNGKKARRCGDTELLGGSGVLRRVRAHRERRHGTTFLSCRSASVGLRGCNDHRSRTGGGLRAFGTRGIPADWPTARWVTREGPRAESTGGGSQQCGLRGSVSRAWRESELEPETMRILSGWECNISRAVQAPNRRGGEKPRGRKSAAACGGGSPRLFFGRVTGSVPGVRKQGESTTRANLQERSSRAEESPTLPVTEGRGPKLWKADRRRVEEDAKFMRGASLVWSNTPEGSISFTPEGQPETVKAMRGAANPNSRKRDVSMEAASRGATKVTSLKDRRIFADAVPGSSEPGNA